MNTDLEQIVVSALENLQEANATDELETWYRRNLGRKGQVYLLTRQVGQLEPQERPAFGKRLNEIKQELQSAYDQRREAVKAAELQVSLAGDALDVTMPARMTARGGYHVVTQTLRDIYRIFGDMGFQIYRSPDVETDEYNFELLNFPPHHPAREMQDSFYTTKKDVILRTHTSPGQVRAMRDYHPEPIRVILPGMCYRNEQITTRSEIQFTQVEGLAVGDNITFADLKGTLTEFARRLFGADRQTRFRASYFPFTEPSAEMDVSCFLCDGEGCQVCKHTGWLEILGCGMVHPNVLKACNVDSEKYVGYAFGMGVERLAMLRYGVTDLRQFFENDVRFLRQFH